MASDSRRIAHVDGDGVRIVKTSGVRAGVWLLVLAMGLVIFAVLVVVRPAFDRGFREVTEPRGDAPASAAAGVRAARPPAQRRHPVPSHAEPAARIQPPPGPVGDAEPVPPRAEAPAPDDAAPEERTGIALFPPPGTEPIKPGILVPEDFELPQGYVRHYQATDTGERVPAILMFHPDYRPVDERGEPVPLPEDRVVPPEMAPPGLPIQMLEVPENQVPMIEVPEDRGEQDSAP